MSNVFFPVEQDESSESAISIRNTLGKNLRREYGMKLDDLDDKNSCMTDFAPGMARVFKSSISTTESSVFGKMDWMCLSYLKFSHETSDDG